MQKVGLPLVESRRKRRARHQMLLRKHALARLPRMEGLPRRRRITKNRNAPILVCGYKRSSEVAFANLTNPERRKQVSRRMKN